MSSGWSIDVERAIDPSIEGLVEGSTSTRHIDTDDKKNASIHEEPTYYAKTHVHDTNLHMRRGSTVFIDTGETHPIAVVVCRPTAAVLVEVLEVLLVLVSHREHG